MLPDMYLLSALIIEQSRTHTHVLSRIKALNGSNITVCLLSLHNTLWRGYLLYNLVIFASFHVSHLDLVNKIETNPFFASSSNFVDVLTMMTGWISYYRYLGGSNVKVTIGNYRNNLVNMIQNVKIKPVSVFWSNLAWISLMMKWWTLLIFKVRSQRSYKWPCEHYRDQTTCILNKKYHGCCQGSKFMLANSQNASWNPVLRVENIGTRKKVASSIIHLTSNPDLGLKDVSASLQ